LLVDLTLISVNNFQRFLIENICKYQLNKRINEKKNHITFINVHYNVFFWKIRKTPVVLNIGILLKYLTNLTIVLNNFFSIKTQDYTNFKLLFNLKLVICLKP